MSDRAILFADVAGSTSLYQRHGDSAAMQCIGNAVAVMERVIDANRGRVVKTIGDEVMAVFNTADDALRASFEIQWQVSELPPLGGEQIAVRVGFHYGSVLDRDGDVFGDSVNLAARLVGVAKAGQIITSGRTLATVDGQLLQYTRRLNRLTLKGMTSAETIHEAIWDDSEDITTMLSATLAPQPLNLVRLRLTYNGTDVVLGPERVSVTLGRDVANDVVILTRQASRVHARIEWRRDKFVLIDQSSNGTYVQCDGSGEVLLRREEFTLNGSGLVSLGRSIGKGADGLLHFHCEGGTHD
jgi:adenylate cyclase